VLQVVNRLKVKAKTCSELYLATDEDREGEVHA
jgi:DNA topoisomerase IA